jgi:hypothetical protein
MWTCPKCKENIENQFNTCWRCAGEAERAATPPERKKPLQQLEFICIMLIVLPGVIAFVSIRGCARFGFSRVSHISR